MVLTLPLRNRRPVVAGSRYDVREPVVAAFNVLTEFFFVDIADEPGPMTLHCHITQHAAGGMVAGKLALAY